VEALTDALGRDAVDVSRQGMSSVGVDWSAVSLKTAPASRPRPLAVVQPTSIGDVQAVLAIAAGFNVSVLPRGLGSSVTGSALPIHGGIVIDLRRLNQVIDIDSVNLSVVVEAGVQGRVLETRLNSEGFTLGHYPQSLDLSTVGGWVSTRATGQASTRYGGIETIVLGLTVVLADGTVEELGLVPRGSVGPDLLQLFVGAEGTLAIITQVRLRIAPLPEAQHHRAFIFRSLADGLSAMREIMQVGLRPALLRLYDEAEAPHALGGQSAPSAPVLFVSTEGSPAVAAAELEVASQRCRRYGGQDIGPEPVERWLRRRFDYSLLEQANTAEGQFIETIEVAHSWSGISATYDRLREGLTPLARDVWGHFSHAYAQGTSLYLILHGEAGDDAQARAQLDAIWSRAMDATLETGGVIAHHHGVGLVRLPYVARQPGVGLPLFRQLKAALDPAGLLAPGRLVDAE
jgi:alkyldihydroxyacetonephosphate synthase